MNRKLEGKVIYVSGGAGLLGREFSRAIVDEGGFAVIADKNIQAMKHEIEAVLQGNENYALEEVDITSKSSLRSSFQRVIDERRSIHGLVNAAYPRNKRYGAKLENVEYDDFVENVGMHLGGYFLAMKEFSKYAREGASIVNISSVYGLIAPKFEIYDGTEMTMPVEYAAIKSGLNHLTEYMAKYFKGRGIRFNCVSPGGIRDKQPQSFIDRYNSHCLNKGMLDPNDISGAVLFLLSDDSRYINGRNLVVDDGFCL